MHLQFEFTHLRGLANVEKRYIIHLAGFNLGILLRALFGFGTPGVGPMLEPGCFLPESAT